MYTVCMIDIQDDDDDAKIEEIYYQHNKTNTNIDTIDLFQTNLNLPTTSKPDEST